MVPNNYFSTHMIDHIEAFDASRGEALILMATAGDVKTQVTLFFREVDPDYVARLIAAINAVERRPPVPDAAHAAAHDAANAIYGRDAL